MSNARTAQELAAELKQARHEYGKALAGCDSKPIRLARALDLGRAIDAAIDRLATLASQAEPVAEWRNGAIPSALHALIDAAADNSGTEDPFYAALALIGEYGRSAPPAPAQAEPTMADAIAAGDGTLHGAIDYWQQRALKAEQSEDGRDAARWPATKFQNLKPVGYASVVDIDRYELPFCVGTHLPGVRDVALYTRDQVLAAIAAKEQS